MTDDTSPQLGHYDVDRAALSGDGEPLDALLDALGARDVAVPPDAPEIGWRVLSRSGDERPILIGSPAHPDGSAWRVAQLYQDVDGPGRFSVHPETLSLRRSVAERRAGLVLRWPAVTRDLLDFDALAVDIVNEGAERWLPDGDDFYAVAVLRPVGDESHSIYFGFAGGANPAPALDPGEYVRVIARIDSSAWRMAEPGPHHLTAFAPMLRLTTAEPLLVELTTEVIDARRPPEPRVEPPHQRVLAADRLRHVRVMRAARDAFPELIEAIKDARDDAHALSRIQDILHCDDSEAQAAYNLQLRRARIGYQDVLAMEIEDLERQVENDEDGEP
jgi:hypothetical protein